MPRNQCFRYNFLKLTHLLVPYIKDFGLFQNCNLNICEFYNNCMHTSDTVRPPQRKRGQFQSGQMGWSTENPGKESQSQGALVAKNRQKWRSTETEEIIIPAPGGRPSHPPTHNTSTTSPWSQYPSPLQSGISSPHLLNSPSSYL